ncbi:methyltransferase domain-containing protein [Candidatus Woesearchaeota archaeon]|nr:methyltransferase domain-containing protein [Candidatus Woesearchaeota archaeon]MBT7555580.1 methyltransferase domain-containing protein [Candidatus Woesearchaeota archaeon]
MNDYMTTRDSCRLCLHNKLSKVFDLPLTPPGEQLKLTSNENDPSLVPIDLYQCEKCGHVQVVNIPHPDTLFGSKYTFMTRGNPLLIKHFDSSVDYFLDNYTSDINFAIEIGSNDGVFLENIRDKIDCKVLGIDPSLEPVNVARSYGVDTILDYFTPELSNDIVNSHGYPDLVIANNVFAHMDDLRSVMKGVGLLLKNNGYFMFEVSYLKDVVEKYLIGTIIHEHLSVHSVYSLTPFLNEFGFNLVGVKHVDNIQGGAIVGVARKERVVNTLDEIIDIVENEKLSGITDVEGMQEFNRKFHNNIDNFKKLINRKIGKTKIIGFGAARSSPLAIDLLGLRERISYIIDNDPLKIGKFMPIGSIPIVDINKHIECMGSIGTQTYIVLGWAQTERIIRKILSITEHCSIITIYPKFEIRNY